MKYAVCSALILLGAIEMFYGVFLGGMMVHGREISFSRSLNLNPEKYRIMNEYFHKFRGNWGILTITAEEAAFARALDLHPYRYPILSESLDVFRDDWSVVSFFGFLNILLVLFVIKIQNDFAFAH